MPLTPRRRLLTALATVTVLVAALSGATAAQGDPVTYTDGTAQVLARVGPTWIEDLVLVEGAMDPVAGRLVLRYRQDGGKATLTIAAPNVPGVVAAQPKDTGGAAISYRKLHGASGATAACLVAWNVVTPTQIAGSFSCPNARTKPRKGARTNLVGTFDARAVPDDGVTAATPPFPIHPLGTTVEAEGQSLTPLTVTDLERVCVKGTGGERADCAKDQVLLDGPFRAITLRACVSDGGEATRFTERTGVSRILFGGTPEAFGPIGLNAYTHDPAVTVKPLPRVLNPGSCADGYAIAGTRGPLLVWTPPNGAAPVAWTLDPVALPPTAEGPGPDGGTATASPAPDGVVPAGSATWTGGFADLLSDGAEMLAADDLVLTEGTFLSDGQGASIVHLAFASPSGAALTIDVPDRTGTFSWDAGAGTANTGVAWAIGGVTADAGLTGCTVDIGETDGGGLQGSYACTLEAGGTGSGAFAVTP